ncbi:MAG: hypothetical protein ACTSVC_12090, partial [Promethearchaeota archaeon]
MSSMNFEGLLSKELRLFLLMVLLLFSSTFSVFMIFNSNNSNSHNMSSKTIIDHSSSPKSSQGHDGYFFNGNDDLSKSCSSGSGTPGDPYVFRDLTFD